MNDNLEKSFNAGAFEFLTLYARYEPTTDNILPEELRKQKKYNDVCIYSDKNGIQFEARFPWFYSGSPTPKRQSLILDCAKYNLEWI